MATILNKPVYEDMNLLVFQEEFRNESDSSELVVLHTLASRFSLPPL
jgi:hypothetical protein